MGKRLYLLEVTDGPRKGLFYTLNGQYRHIDRAHTFDTLDEAQGTRERLALVATKIVPVEEVAPRTLRFLAK